MACSLREDPAGLVDALGPVGAKPTIFIRSDDSLTARITAAEFNGVHVPVGATGTVQLPALKGGPNTLDLTVVGVNRPGDDLQLMEDCGAGASQFVKKKFAGTGPGGGASPVVGFDIQAS